MTSLSCSLRSWIGLILILLAAPGALLAQESIVYTEPGAGQFEVPSAVSRITVQVWGAGGSGGGVGRGGGGGGAYSVGAFSVSPGDRVPFVVGEGAAPTSELPGGTSWFSSPGELSAGGGSSGRNSTTRAGAAGSTAGLYRGGNGAAGATGLFDIPVRGGGGGSSAGSSADGTSAFDGTGAAAPFDGGGGGSEGGTALLIFGGNGEPGETPGGGGGAAGVGWFGAIPGRGGHGQIRISWMPIQLCSVIYSSDTGINGNLDRQNRLDLDVFGPRVRTPWPGNSVIPAGNHVYPPREFAQNQNNINFSVDGSARVIVDGDLIISGNNFSMNAGGDPSNLLLIVDGNLEFKNNANLNAIVYVTGDVEFNQNPVLVGAIAAEGSISGLANSDVTFERQMIARTDFGGACTNEEPGVALHHFRIYHPSTALTCTPASALRVRACSNADCTELFSEPLTIALAPASGWLSGNNISFVGEANNLGLRSTKPGPVSLGVEASTINAAGSPPVRCFADDAAIESNCEILFSDSGFILNIPNHVSGEEVQASILAVKEGEDSPGQCVPAFTGQRSVELNFGYQNPLTGTTLPESSGVELSGNTLELIFDGSGASSFPLRYRDVGAISLQASFNGAGDEEGLFMEGADSFIARPDRFEISIPDNPQNPDVTDANVFRSAGDAFGVEVLALNALGERTPNFGREQPAEGVTLTVEQAAGFSLPNLAVLEGELGSFGESCVEPLGGMACGEFSWPEVGTFALRPSLSSGAYLGTENVAGPVVPYVGRFIPAWFEITIDPGRFSSEPVSSDRTSCSGERSWVYTGEPFGWDMPPELILTPKNRNGVTTENYAGTAFQRLGIEDLVFAEFPVEDESATGVDGTPMEADAILAPAILSPAVGGDLIYRFASDDEFWYPKTRNARVDAYGPQLAFSLDGLADADGVTVRNPAEDLPQAFTPEAEFEIRYGRIVLDNAYGPENLDLVIPLRAEVFASGGFRIHEDENCWFYDLPENTSVDFDGSAFATGQTGVVEVAEAELALEDGRPVISGAADYRLKLSAPSPSGTESPSASGIRVELDTGNDWLKDFWDADNPDSLVSPYAWATFGVYRGNDRIIYWREVP